jgi:hypothetical protein
METPNFVFLEQKIYNFCNKSLFVLFVCFILWFAGSRKKNAAFSIYRNKWSRSYFGTMGTESCVFWKSLFGNFCKESSYDSCSNMKVSDKIACFCVFRNEMSQSFLFSHENPKSFIFWKNFFRTTFVTKVCVFVRSFLVIIWKFAKKLSSLDFIETNGPNNLFRTWRRQKLCF